MAPLPRPVQVLLAAIVPVLLHVTSYVIAHHGGAHLGKGLAMLNRAPLSNEQRPPVTNPSPPMQAPPMREAQVRLSDREPGSPPARPAGEVARSPQPVRSIAPQQPPSRGVFVRSATVLKLARARLQPSATFVAATDDHPAGLMLTNASAMGVGLVDGDILTHAGGAPARSMGAVVAMVLRARAERLPVISGRIWRRGLVVPIAVEQPYPQPPERGSKSPLSPQSQAVPVAEPSARNGHLLGQTTLGK